jgi:hypothetical protein
MDARFNVEARINKHFFQDFNDGRPMPLLEYSHTVVDTVSYKVRTNGLTNEEMAVLVRDCKQYGYHVAVWCQNDSEWGGIAPQLYVSFTPIA